MKSTFIASFFSLTTVLSFSCAGPGTGESSETIKFYVGSSDGSLEYSIFLCEMDPSKGKIAVVDSFAGAISPNYLALSPDQKHLYSINDEIFDSSSEHMSVSSFSIQPGNLKLELLNSQSSKGLGPCHIFCSKNGKYIFTANYGSGNLAAFPILKPGKIQPASAIFQSSGAGPDENRQQGPHTHYVSLDPKEKYLLSPDLGTDRVLILKFDHEDGTLTPNPAQPYLELAPGAGPRHLVFHPSGKFVYVVNELDATVTACRYNEENGTLVKLKTVSTVLDTHKGSKYPAAIRVHPSGNFVYASTRGEESSIAVYQVDEKGEFYRIQVMDNVPEWPRDFNIDPSGNYLLAAGEHSDEIQLYQIDKATGKLNVTQTRISLPSPGCILYINK